MEEIGIPLHSWFWMIVPMITVFILSVLNYIRNRTPVELRGEKTPNAPDNTRSSTRR